MKAATAVAGALVILAAAIYFRPPAPPPPAVRSAATAAPVAHDAAARAPRTVVERQPPAAARASPRQQLRALLDHGDYDAAVAWYDDLYRRVDETTSQVYRDDIHRFAELLVEGRRHRAVAALLSRYTALFHKDVPALLLLAGSQHALKDHAAAIETLYTALVEVHDPRHLVQLRRQLAASVHEQAQTIGQAQSKEAVIRFYESMLAREPDFGPYQWGLAAAYLDAERPQAALAALDRITDLSLIERARSLRQAIERRQARERIEQTAIPLQRTGYGFSVRARINGYPVVLLIDTGASMTTVRPEVLARAGVGGAARRQHFATASGTVQAPVMRVDSLEIAGHRVRDLEVGGLTLPGLEVDGLLGMNYLGRFEFTIRQQEGLMYLQR